MGKRLLGRNRTSEQGTWYNTLIAVGIAAIRCLGPPGRSSKRKSRSTATIPIRRVAVVIPAIVRIVIAGQGPKILHSSASAFAFSAVASRTCHSQYQSIPNQKSLLWRPYCSTTTPPPPPPPPTTIQSSTMMKGTNNNGDDDDAIPTLLQRLSPAEVTLEIKDPVNPRALQQATAILHELSQGTEGTVDPSTLLQVAQRLGDVTQDRCTVPADLVVSKAACAEAYDNLHITERTALTNMYTRIKAFAALQRASVVDTDMAIPGGKAGQTVSPCQAAGCYAPGGRYPLPSSVLMTAVTARTAGRPAVVLCSPKPAPITLAAAHIAGADVFLQIGGAQAIATMAYGLTMATTTEKDEEGSETTTKTITVPPCDVICGPGNQWVTAAKSIVQGKCGIDMLAGPSEVLVICDDTAIPAVVAADLIAQAEHDVVARAILLCTCPKTIHEVDTAVRAQVQALPEPNRSTALAALQHSFAVHCFDLQQAIELSDAIAPEHLEIQTRNSTHIGQQCKNYGGLFIGVGAAEVLGDYGAGPNHTLPTGGTGRYTGGLSVFNFLRIRTWMRVDDNRASQEMVLDAITMARCEGLEGHARAAEHRKL